MLGNSEHPISGVDISDHGHQNWVSMKYNDGFYTFSPAFEFQGPISLRITYMSGDVVQTSNAIHAVNPNALLFASATPATKPTDSPVNPTNPTQPPTDGPSTPTDAPTNPTTTPTNTPTDGPTQAPTTNPACPGGQGTPYLSVNRALPLREYADWMYGARVADIGFDTQANEASLKTVIDKLAAEKGTVAETDITLSDYLTDAQFDAVMTAATRWNGVVHAAGLNVVWYYPALEIISIGGEDGPSYAKDHPDELQIGLNGSANVFYYPKVFWVKPGDESAWASPNSPYINRFFEKVQKIARTNADGVWIDVPVYFDAVFQWCDHSTWAAAAFLADTGLRLPKVQDWADPVWRRWISWRHENLYRFLQQAGAAGRAINPNFYTIVEIFTVDYSDATLAGLDGAYLKKDPNLTVVWEVTVTSDSHGMRYASEDDWISLIAIYKYCRAAVGLDKPSWAFSYAIKEDDAISVMAEVVATGNSPYEVRTPGKEAGVGGSVRPKMFGLVTNQLEYLFNSSSLAKVAVYHSSSSRDFVKPGDGTGLFCSEGAPPSIKAQEQINWYSDSSGATIDTCYNKQWMGEYRGCVKALVNAHIPFELITSPNVAAVDLDPFKVIILPDIETMSDNEATLFTNFVTNGGILIVTGPSPSSMDEFGTARAELALSSILGFGIASIPATNVQTTGLGTVYYYKDLIGWNYIKETRVFQANMPPVTSSANFNALINPIQSHFTSPITLTNAHRCVHMTALSHDANTLVLQFTNFVGVCEVDRNTRGKVFPITPVTFGVNVSVESGKQVKSVQVATPDANSLAALPYTYTSTCGGSLTFDLTTGAYSVIIVSFM